MVAVAASPTPGTGGSHFSAKSLHEHPPYKDMIVKAIAALKNQKGSSRIAISKYIADNYTGLPPSHSALLSKHLHRLLLKGVIRMKKLSYLLSEGGSAIGSKRRGRPPKNSLPALTVHYDSPKKRGRPRKFEADLPPFKTSKSGRLLNTKPSPVVDSASVYILPQAEHLDSGFFKSLPGAMAIILPQGLLSKNTARSPVLILPNGFQSLANSPSGNKKQGRPRKVAIQNTSQLPKNVVKMQPFQRKKKSMLRKQAQLLRNEDMNDRGNLVVRKPARGRPRKINNFVLSEKLQLKSVNEERLASAEAALELLKDGELPIMPEVDQGKQVSPVFLLKKRSVGRPRKIPIG